MGEAPAWWDDDGTGRAGVQAGGQEAAGSGGQPVGDRGLGGGSGGGAGRYPMDYYAADGGEWGSSYHRRIAQAGPARLRAAA